jgi:hypothetical protein
MSSSFLSHTRVKRLEIKGIEAFTTFFE